MPVEFLSENFHLCISCSTVLMAVFESILHLFDRLFHLDCFFLLDFLSGLAFLQQILYVLLVHLYFDLSLAQFFLCASIYLNSV